MESNIREVNLPNDCLRLIFSYLDWEHFALCCSVKKQWECVGSDPKFLKYQIYWKQTFNPQCWDDHFAELIYSNNEAKRIPYYGNIDLDHSLYSKAYDTLPDEIGKLFKSSCPIFQGKKWGETHDIIWIPTNVNVWKIIYLLIDKGFLKRNSIMLSKFDLTPTEKPTWIAMTKVAISKGEYNTIFNQQNRMTQYESGYHFPKIAEAIIWTYVRLLKKKSFLHNILCQENDSKSNRIVEFYGFKNRNGISISSPYLDIRIYNAIALRKL